MQNGRFDLALFVKIGIRDVAFAPTPNEIINFLINFNFLIILCGSPIWRRNLMVFLGYAIDSLAHSLRHFRTSVSKVEIA